MENVSEDRHPLYEKRANRNREYAGRDWPVPIVVKGLLVRCEKTSPSTGELAISGRHALFNGCLSAYGRLFRRLHRQ